MRFITKSACLALIAACSLSAVAVASASASEFTFSKTGTLKGASSTRQSLTTAAGHIECSTSISGSTGTLKSTTLKVTVRYEKCAAFGFASKFSPAEYEYNTNGTVKLLKEVVGEAGEEACVIKIPAQTLSGIDYANDAGKLEEKAAVTGIVSEGAGVCAYSKESKGTLVGTSLVELVGGTLEIS
jgi:transaldolase